MRTVTRQTYRIFWDHARKHRLTLLVMILSLGAATAVAALVPFYYKRFFDVLEFATSGAAPRRAAIGDLTAIVVFIFFLWGLAWLFYRIATFLNAYFQPRVMADLTLTSFDYLHNHSYGFFINRFSGAVVRRVNRFTDAFESLADRMYWDLFPMLLKALIVLGVLWYWHPFLGFLLAGWLVLFWAVNYVFALYKLRYDVQSAAADTEVTGQLADTITNNVNIKIFTALSDELRWFGALLEKQFRIRRLTWNLGAGIEGVQAALMITLEFLVFYFAIRFWARGVLTLGDFALIQGYLVQIFRQMWDFWRVIRDIYRRLADAEEMTEILRTPHQVRDKPAARELVVPRGEVEFRNVSFAYTPTPIAHQKISARNAVRDTVRGHTKTRDVIRNFNLVIKPGEKVGLVGPSGAGKSTLAALVFRFFDVQEGGIYIDGQNIADVTQESLRRNIGYVPQDPILFHRSLMENIRYGRRDAQGEEVFSAARDAHCDEFIERLPQGYETHVGERGIRLSGGERQRVAIARAILKNAPILVLDEATSSLDSHSEGLIQDALSRLMEGRTTIVIAHRLSTIMKMDRIVVIRDGAIYETGTHSELLQKPDGLYKKLWELQAGGFIAV